MTRSIGRRKEFAVRSALGASRASLFSQLLTESLLLSFIGAAVGLLGAQWGVNLLVAAIPESQLQSMPYLRDTGMSLPVVLFLGGVTVLTGILFGLAPGLDASRTSLNDVLKDESRGGTSAAHARLRNALVIAEISISLVLLVGAGLLLKSLHVLLGRDPGFNVHNVLTFSVNLPDSAYPSEKTPPYYSAAAVHFDHEFTARRSPFFKLWAWQRILHPLISLRRPPLSSIRRMTRVLPHFSVTWCARRANRLRSSEPHALLCVRSILSFR